MSVLLEFAMFPTDKGESVSEYVSLIIEEIKQSGFDYRLTPMGTVVETDTFVEATAVMSRCYDALTDDCNRVYCSAKFDIRKNKGDRMNQKIQSIEDRIGDVNK
ncbi:MAG TPA: MTH1187 family thiamine-binding protein [Prolixibacteraceae bacterium]|nr:MTH1187 family thiamine-binding protein [Prolixibacteraceae bacterium]